MPPCWPCSGSDTGRSSRNLGLPLETCMPALINACSAHTPLASTRTQADVLTLSRAYTLALSLHGNPHTRANTFTHAHSHTHSYTRTNLRLFRTLPNTAHTIRGPRRSYHTARTQGMCCQDMGTLVPCAQAKTLRYHRSRLQRSHTSVTRCPGWAL